MKLTPIEIRQKSFERGFRGYEKEEVDAYLHVLSKEWEKGLEETRELKRRLEISEKEVQRLRDVESSLFKTIKSAEFTGASVIEQANKAANLHLKEAQIKAEAVLHDARARAKNMVEEAEESARETLSDLQADIKNLIKEVNSIEDYRQTLLQSLSSIAKETFEKVERINSRSTKIDFEKRLRELRFSVTEKTNLNKSAFETSAQEMMPLPNLNYQEDQPVSEVKYEKLPELKPEFKEPDPIPEIKAVEIKQENKPEVEPEPKKEENPKPSSSGSFFDNI